MFDVFLIRNATRCKGGMDEKRGKLSFPGSGKLDPRAEEFRPENNSTKIAPLIHHLPCHFHEIYYPCPCPPFPFHFPFPSLYPYPYPVVPPLPLSRPFQFLLPLVSSLSAVTPSSQPQPQPTRALLLSPVTPVAMTEETVKAELQVFGKVRAVEMERLLQDGIITVHFYDLRHAQVALEEIQRQYMHQQTRFRLHYTTHQAPTQKSFSSSKEEEEIPTSSSGLISGHAVWAQFILPPPATVSSSKQEEHSINNQGTIVVFNLDSRVSTCKVKEMFQAFGSVKEVREAPFKRQQRFIEFFDIRDAARAIKEMDGKEVNGNRIFIEFSRPGVGGGGQRGGGPGVSSSSNSRTRNIFFYRASSKFPSPPAPPPPYSSKSFRRSNTDASSSGKTSNNFGRNVFSRRDDRYYGGAPKALITSGSLSVVVNKDGESEMINYYNGLSSPSTKSTHKKNQNNNKFLKQRKQQQQQLRSNRPAAGKNKQKRSFDTQFSIKEDAIFGLNGVTSDTRTTVTIKDIPNKYSQKLLLNMLDNHCINCNEQVGDGDDQPLSSYDFVYLPIDFNNKCNVGYGFLNLTSPQATWRLYKAFHLQHREVFNSRKICHITYARLQGLDALKEHFKNSKFACETNEYLPVLFRPARDGKHHTDPMPIGGHTITVAACSTFCSTKQKINHSPQLVSPQITNGKGAAEEEKCLHGHPRDEGGDCGGCRGGIGNDSGGMSRTSSSSTSNNILYTSSSGKDSTTGDEETTNGCLTCSDHVQQQLKAPIEFRASSGHS